MGAKCSGRVRFARGTRTLGAKRFTMAAGQTRTVKVKLKKSAFKALKRAGTRKVTLAISGTDASAARFAAKQTVRLLAPKLKPRT